MRLNNTNKIILGSVRGYFGSVRGESARKGCLFQAQIYERVGILSVEVYDEVGKSVIYVCKKARKGSQMHFIMAVKTSRKRSQSGFLFIHI